MSAIYAAVVSLNASPSTANAASAPDPTAAASSTSALGSGIQLHFDLPAGPMDKALRDFAVQAGRNISYEPSIVAGLQAPAIKGDFTVGDALTLLLKGTKLRAVDVNTKTIRILENISLGTSLQTMPETSSSKDGETQGKNDIAQYRKESFGNTFILPVTDNTFYPSRDVDAGYVELHVPVQATLSLR